MRQRHCLDVLLKKIRFSPVIAIQGARQTGKSVLVREILPTRVKKMQFHTFDSPASRDFALSNPESYLAHLGNRRLVAIDEAQKVPEIFSVIKLRVDSDRHPGMYILLGSTQFSTLAGIRESLTGRMSRIRLFPFTLGEANQLPLSRAKTIPFLTEKQSLSRAALMKHLYAGGLPGIFFVRSESERQTLFDDWIALTCERDLLQVHVKNLDPVIARRILEQVAKISEPSTLAIARELRLDPRRVHKHLQALEELFVIHSLRPHPVSKGKPLYFLFDVGMATHLGANFERQLHTYLLNEVLAKISYLGLGRHELSFLRGTRKGLIHLIIEGANRSAAIKVLAEERLNKRDIQGLVALKNKLPRTRLIALGSQRWSLRKEGVEVYPWESLA